MENEGTEQPLLTKKKVYYENCPGCKVDYRKDTSTAIPVKEFFSCWILSLCSGVSESHFLISKEDRESNSQPLRD
ncbi:hypothetical protein ACHQM5_012984 [Ranunculus cassubicifolius]